MQYGPSGSRRTTMLYGTLRPYRLALICTAVMSVLGSPKDGVGQAVPTLEPEIHSLRFEGNTAFSNDSLAAVLRNRETECRSVVFLPFCWLKLDFAYDRGFRNNRQLQADVLRVEHYYLQRGYREARTTLDEIQHDDGSLDLLFSIDEGRPVLVDSIVILGANGVHEPSLLGDLPLKVGDLHSQILIKAAGDTLVRRLQRAGYAHVDIFPVSTIRTDTPYSASVAFDIEAGPRTRFGTVTVVGNEKVSESVILRTLAFEAGDYYSPETVRQAQRNIYDLGPIAAVTFTPTTNTEVDPESLFTPPDTIINYQVRVTEGDAHRVRGGVGWTTAECLNVEGRWTSRNFQGGARRLELRSRLSNIFAPTLNNSACPQSGSDEFSELNWLVSADFTQPWVFSTRNSLTFGIFGERQSLADVFVRRAFGLNMALSRTISDRTNLTLGYRPELTRLDATEIFFCSSALVCRPEDVAVLQETNLLAPLLLTWSRDRTDQLLGPTEGYSAVAELEHASTATFSDFTFNRAAFETRLYRSLESEVVATRFRIGWVGSGGFDKPLRDGSKVDLIHPQKRFFGGGSNSVRGFGENRLGPRVLSVDVADVLIPGTSGVPVCTPAEINDLSCDVQDVSSSDFISRATGGSLVIEANAELRAPLGGERWEGALFLDVGQVWDEPGDFSLSELEFTPGFGVRYVTPVGPIRIDLGYRFQGDQSLQVVTSDVRAFDPLLDDPSDRIRLGDQVIDFVRSSELALLTPRVMVGDPSGFSLRRFQIHFSIGQAF